MDHLKRLVYVHYNMRLKARHLQRNRNDDSQMIDLDHIFHEDDPLAQWTREAEFSVLDDSEENAWLDEALLGEDRPRGHPPGVALHPPEKLYKRKQNRRQQERDKSSSPDDQDPPGGDGDPSAYGQTGERSEDPSPDASDSHEHRDYDRHQREDRGGDTYGGQSDYHGYRRSSDYYGGYGNPPIHEAYSGGDRGGHDEYFAPYRHSDVSAIYDSRYRHGSNVTGQSSSQDSHDTPFIEPGRHSVFDDMMISFLGPEQLQYCYPPHYSAPDDTSLD